MSYGVEKRVRRWRLHNKVFICGEAVGGHGGSGELPSEWPFVFLMLWERLVGGGYFGEFEEVGGE